MGVRGVRVGLREGREEDGSPLTGVWSAAPERRAVPEALNESLRLRQLGFLQADDIRGVGSDAAEETGSSGRVVDAVNIG